MPFISDQSGEAALKKRIFLIFVHYNFVLILKLLLNSFVSNFTRSIDLKSDKMSCMRCCLCCSARRDEVNEAKDLDIALPTNVVQGINIRKNPMTGELEGLPDAWYELLKKQLTEQEQSDNPSAGK